MSLLLQFQRHGCNLLKWSSDANIQLCRGLKMFILVLGCPHFHCLNGRLFLLTQILYVTFSPYNNLDATHNVKGTLQSWKRNVLLPPYDWSSLESNIRSIDCIVVILEFSEGIVG